MLRGLAHVAPVAELLAQALAQNLPAGTVLASPVRSPKDGVRPDPASPGLTISGAQTA